MQKETNTLEEKEDQKKETRVKSLKGGKRQHGLVFLRLLAKMAWSHGRLDTVRLHVSFDLVPIELQDWLTRERERERGRSKHDGRVLHVHFTFWPCMCSGKQNCNELQSCSCLFMVGRILCKRQLQLCFVELSYHHLQCHLSAHGF